MKKISLSLMTMLAMVVLFERCAAPEEGVDPTNKVRFSFSLPPADATEETAITGIRPDAFLLVSLANASGTEVLSQKRLSISQLGDHYESELIDLPAGNYTVTDFRIMNEASQELYTFEQIEALGSDDAGSTIAVENSGISTIILKVVRAARHLKLREFVLDDRHYELYYNRRGDVDSIVAHQGTLRYVYSVVYTRGRIDSVMTINSGDVESIHDDFVYDSQGRITSYNYYYRLEGVPEDLAFPTTITYDARGNVQSINGNSFTYDNRRNMVAGFGATYTHDHGLNPFYFVNNLFAIMVEEPFIAESVLSKHNFATKTVNGNTFHFNNVYDSRKRLISQGNTRFYYY